MPMARADTIYSVTGIDVLDVDGAFQNKAAANIRMHESWMDLLVIIGYIM